MNETLREIAISSRDFYVRPGEMTSLGADKRAFDELPRDIAGLVNTIQGVLLHQHLAHAYGVELTDKQKDEPNIRPVKEMLVQILDANDAPLTRPRAPKDRLIGVCRHFTVMFCTMLRHRGVPARARCGFGAYFVPGRFEDHWVAEYWDAAKGRWRMVDAQIDAVQRKLFKPDFDTLDVPRDRFIVAGEAWRACRSGKHDPMLYGIFDIRGLYFVAGNVVRDFAALNNMEMLPWDVWGAMFAPDAKPTEKELAFIDELAALTLAADDRLEEMRKLYERDDGVRVPAKCST